ncbi:PTS ascorbate transporter subunit IIC [Mesomycoplasma conjunctivae]|uniref:PTS ascorbate transporter subunit IIC n=1 Tax=Mesomycoplasma conjunctivae TaxID=45361 RepID=UPI003DA5AD07
MSLDKKKNRKILYGWLAFLLINILIIAITLGVRMGVKNESFSTALIFLIQTVYLDNFLRQNPILLGSLTLVGYLILGRGARDSILGALKTAIGVFLLSIGAGGLIGLAAPVFATIRGIKTGVVPLDPYLGWTSAQQFLEKGFGPANDFLTLSSFVFLLGFAVNIVMVLLKRFTNTNSIMITGHVMLQQSTIVTALLYVILFRSVPLLDGGAIAPGSQIGLVIIAGLFIGIYWATASTATLKITNLVTQNSGFAVGHQQMLTLVTSYKLGRFFGKKEDTAEERKLPGYLKIFEDNIFTQTVIILLLFAILFAIIIGTYGVENSIAANYAGFNTNSKIGGIKAIASAWNGTFGGANFVFIIFGGSLRIVAALLAIITGVRMFVTELQQSFHGISEKIIPDAVVAVDIAATYGFSINAVTYGFISGVIGQFLAVFIMVGISAIPGNNFSLVAIPLFITLFFNSGAQGVYANASGGWKAAVIVPAIIGFFEIIFISFALKLISNIEGAGIPMIQDANLPKTPVDSGFLGMGDWNFFFGIVLIIGQFHAALGWISTIGAIILLLLLAQITDSTTQHKKTFLQKLFKVNVDLVAR